MNREDFPLLKNDIIYFDNSATTLRPKSVIEAVCNYYENMTANVHRGDYDLSHNVDIEYENTRKTVANFINAQKEEIVFTNGATSGINMVSYGLGEMIINPGDEIIISEAEHGMSDAEAYARFFAQFKSIDKANSALELYKELESASTSTSTSLSNSASTSACAC